MPGDKKDNLILSVIILLLLTLRLAYFLQLKSGPLFGFFSLDSGLYDNFALQILSGRLFSPNTIYLNSVYPFFLAMIYFIAGHSISAVIICQIAISALSCLGIYIICNLLFPQRKVGLVASFIYACYDIAIFYTGFLLDSTLSLFLLVSAAALLILAHKTDKKAPWISSGAAMGLASILRGNIIFCLPFIFFWFLTRIRAPLKHKAPAIALFLAGLLITFIPFSAKRYVANGIFSPFPVNGGISFYIGNNPKATGLYSPLYGISDAPIKQIKTSIRMAELETGSKFTPLEASNYWFSKGLSFIKDNPGRFLALLEKKAGLFWNREETDMNINFEFCKGYIPFFRLPFFSFGIVAPLALCGMIWALWRREKGLYIILLFIAAYFVSLLVFFVSSRYRLPVVPFLIIMAAYALCNLGILLRLRDIKKLCVFSALLIALFLFVNRDIPDISAEDFASNHNNLGNTYYERDLFREAQAEYKKALAINPDFSRARANLANTYRELGDFKKAFAEYNDAIRINPRNANAYAGLAAAYDLTGDIEKAIDAYRKALEINPLYTPPHIELGLLYFRKGMLDEAAAENKKALELEEDAVAYNNLGNIYYAKGMIAEAQEKYEKALEVEPDYADCHSNLAVLYYYKKDTPKAVHHYKKAVEYGTKPNLEFQKLLNTRGK